LGFIFPIPLWKVSKEGLGGPTMNLKSRSNLVKGEHHHNGDVKISWIVAIAFGKVRLFGSLREMLLRSIWLL
jgi:hypothetical protein